MVLTVNGVRFVEAAVHKTGFEYKISDRTVAELTMYPVTVP